MEAAFKFALVFDVLVLAAGLEGYRRRLALRMGPSNGSREYPYSSTGFAPLMGWLLVWTGEHRGHHDLWLSRFAWAARIGMLGVLAIILAFASAIGGR